MKEKVRKYFMAGTDEEVLIGDVISVELVKDFEDGRTLTREMEFKVTEDTIPEALKLGIIEEYKEEKVKEYVFKGKFTEKEVDEDKEDLVDFNEEVDDDFEFRKCVAQDIDEIREWLREHSEELKTLQESILACKEMIACMKDLYESKSLKKTVSRKKAK